MRDDLIPADTLHYLHSKLGPISSLSPIGHGNTNQIFLAKGRNQASVVVKVPQCGKISLLADAELPPERNSLERWALSELRTISQHIKIPRVLHASELFPCFVMENISPARSWNELSLEERRKGVVAVLGFCEDCQKFGSIAKIPPELSSVADEMSNCIDALSFALPQTVKADPYQVTGSYGLEALSPIQKDILSCDYVRAVNESARAIYRSSRNNLIHGDLHNLSVLSSENDLFIIDPEFCRIGSSAFDAGVFIAHTFIFEAANLDYPASAERFREAAGWVCPEFHSTAGLESPLFCYWTQVRMFCLNEIFAKLVGPVPSYWLTIASRDHREAAILVLAAFLRHEARMWCEISQTS